MNRLKAMFAVALAALLPALANAQAPFPNRPVKIVVPYPAGGPTDAVARIYAEGLASALGQPFVVENRPGAAGAIGIQSVVKAAPDGYTFVLGTASTVAVNQFLNKLSYDPVTELEPVSLLVLSPILLSANASQPFKSLPDLMRHAKANPGKLNFGSDGQGSFTHLVGELFKKAAGIQMTHVPYKGTADSLNALIAGDIQLAVGGISNTILGFRESRRLNVLAVAGPRRLASLPDVPTMSESGITGFDASSWYALLAPAGIDPSIVRRISEEVGRIALRPEVAARLTALGQDPQTSTPDALRARIKAESDRWAALIRESGIKVD